MPVNTAPQLRFGVTKEELTDLAGLSPWRAGPLI